VNITDLRDAKTMKRFGQAGEVNLDVFSNRMSGFHQKSVECSRARERNKPQPNEVAAREVWSHYNASLAFRPLSAGLALDKSRLSLTYQIASVK
jgi:hypothetical protein